MHCPVLIRAVMITRLVGYLYRPRMLGILLPLCQRLLDNLFSLCKQSFYILRKNNSLKPLSISSNSVQLFIKVLVDLVYDSKASTDLRLLIMVAYYRPHIRADSSMPINKTEINKLFSYSSSLRQCRLVDEDEGTTRLTICYKTKKTSGSTHAGTDKAVIWLRSEGLFTFKVHSKTQ